MRLPCSLGIGRTSAAPSLPTRPILFVAREPDETLRTFLPVIAELQRRGRQCCVLFHYQPGPWAVERLSELGVARRHVCLPKRPTGGGPLARSRAALALGELEQLRRARKLASRLLRQTRPAAVVVIQDTLLLERFLVREANR